MKWGELHAALTARIGELEREAKSATYAVGESPWNAVSGSSYTAAWGVETADDSKHIVAENCFEEVALYVAAWDPATVLRGLAEDRDILARHAPDPECTGWGCSEIASLGRRHGIVGDQP